MRSFLLSITTLALFSLLTSGCVSTWTQDPVRKGDIREYRYFDEYGGYLPVVRGKNVDQVKGEWLFSGDRPAEKDDALPQSVEAAEQRIQHRSKEELLRGIGRTSLAVVATPLMIPVFLIGEPLHHYYLEPKEARRRQERFNEMVGVKISLTVLDPEGRPAPGAMVREEQSISMFFCCANEHVNEQGLRSFGPPGAHVRSATLEFHQALARHLPIELGTWMRCGLHGGSAPVGLLEHYPFGQSADNDGKVVYTSRFFDRYAEYKDSRWRWKEPPPMVTYYFIVWAPGFQPLVLPVKGVQPLANIERSVVLERLPDHAEVSRIGNELLRIRDEFVRECGSPDEEQLQAGIEHLREWAVNDTLPTYLRSNAAHLLRSALKRNVIEPSGPFQHAVDNAADLSAYLEDGPENPWRFRKAYDKWRDGLNRLCYGTDTPAATIAALAHDARRLLPLGEAIAPGTPQVETLRAFVYLAGGLRQEAVRSSRYMKHCEFFGLFYPEVVFH